MNNLDKISFCLLLVSLIIICLLMGFVLGVNFYITDNEESFTNLTISNLTQDCNNLSLQNTSFCFRNNLLPYYNYTIMEDNNSRTELEILHNGGDCHDYARLYYMWANNTSFYMEIKRIGIDNSSSHVFNILHDSSGYCILDQINFPVCFIYG